MIEISVGLRRLEEQSQVSQHKIMESARRILQRYRDALAEDEESSANNSAAK
jgi:hypothetical protein